MHQWELKTTKRTNFNEYSNFIPIYIHICIREWHQKLPAAKSKLYFSRTKQKWNKLVKFTSYAYNFGYELNSNLSFPQWEKARMSSPAVGWCDYTGWEQHLLSRNLQPRRSAQTVEVFMCHRSVNSVFALESRGLWFSPSGAWDKCITTAKTNQEEGDKEQSLHPNVQTNTILYSLHFLRNLHNPQFPSANATNCLSGRCNSKGNIKSIQGVPDEKSMLPPSPSSNTKPFSFLFCTKMHWMFLKTKKLELPTFRRLQVRSCVCGSPMWVCNSMHAEGCWMISNTISVDTAEYRFIFGRLQNFH